TVSIRLDHGHDLRVRHARTHLRQVVAQGVEVDGGGDATAHRRADPGCGASLSAMTAAPVRPADAHRVHGRCLRDLDWPARGVRQPPDSVVAAVFADVVLELGVLAAESQLHGAGGTVTLLADDDFGH